MSPPPSSPPDTRSTLYSRSFSDWLDRPGLAAARRIRRVTGVVPPGERLAELVDAAEIVFYLGGSSTPTMAGTDPGGSIMSSVVPATALLDLMRATTTRRVVLASSGGAVYGVVGELPTPEDHPTEPISIHGHNSLTVERYAMFYARHHGFEPVILRYANPYGPGQLARRGQGVIATWCDALARGRPISRLRRPGDPARPALRRRRRRGDSRRRLRAPSAPGIYNVGSGCSVSLDELAARLQADLRPPGPDRAAPAPGRRRPGDPARLLAAACPDRLGAGHRARRRSPGELGVGERPRRRRRLASPPGVTPGRLVPSPAG